MQLVFLTKNTKFNAYNLWKFVVVKGGTTFQVEATCIEDGHLVKVFASVAILNDCDTNYLASADENHDILCFDGPKRTFFVKENLASVSLGVLSPFVKDDRFSRTYIIENGKYKSNGSDFTFSDFLIITNLLKVRPPEQYEFYRN